MAINTINPVISAQALSTLSEELQGLYIERNGAYHLRMDESMFSQHYLTANLAESLNSEIESMESKLKSADENLTFYKTKYNDINGIVKSQIIEAGLSNALKDYEVDESKLTMVNTLLRDSIDKLNNMESLNNEVATDTLKFEIDKLLALDSQFLQKKHIPITTLESSTKTTQKKEQEDNHEDEVATSLDVLAKTGVYDKDLATLSIDDFNKFNSLPT